jgi:hypothetical protein
VLRFRATISSFRRSSRGAQPAVNLSFGLPSSHPEETSAQPRVAARASSSQEKSSADERPSESGSEAESESRHGYCGGPAKLEPLFIDRRRSRRSALTSLYLFDDSTLRRATKAERPTANGDIVWLAVLRNIRLLYALKSGGGGVRAAEGSTRLMVWRRPGVALSAAGREMLRGPCERRGGEDCSRARPL